MSTAKELIDRQQNMKTKRAQFERQWHMIGMQVLPRYDDFINKAVQGARRDQFIYDSTAPLALESFAAALESLLVPRTQYWHGLAPVDKSLTSLRARRFNEDVRAFMFAARYSPYANFASQIQEVFLELGAFGTGIMFIEDARNRGVCYHTIPLAEAFIAQNAQGFVDTMFRRYELSARAAYQRWGERLPEAIRKWVEKEPDRMFEFLHVAMPNEDVKRGSRTFRGMNIASFDISIEGSTELSVGGFRTMPYAVSRYTTAAREVYGRSPAQMALADIRSLNEMAKTNLRVGQLIADAPILTSDVDALSPFSMKPGAINAGYLNERGDQLAKRMEPVGDPRITLEMENQRRETINRSFLVTLFQILIDTPQMTATEVLERAQEKGALLAPTIGRQQSELLGPMIERELDIHWHAGRIPQPPEELMARGGLKIEYSSPLDRAMRAEEGVGILRTIEAVKPIADIDPTVLRKFNWERTVDTLAEVNGMPVRCLNTEDEMAAKAQQEQQAQAVQQLTELAPQAAAAAKNMAQAQAVARQPGF